MRELRLHTVVAIYAVRHESVSIFFLMIRRPPRSTLDRSSAASDVYKRQVEQSTKALTWIIDPLDGTTNFLHSVPYFSVSVAPVSYTHLRAHETVLDLVCRLLLEKKN